MKLNDLLEAEDVSIKDANDYEDQAKKLRSSGAKVDIDYKHNGIGIEFPDGQEYFLQGDEASDLLDEVPDNVNPEDFIIVVADNW